VWQFLSSTTNHAASLYLINVTNTTFTLAYYVATASGTTHVLDTATVTAQAWNHILVSYDGTNATIRVNGTSGSGAQAIQAPTNELYDVSTLGNSGSGSNTFQLVGREAMFAVYSTALSGTFAGDHYTAGSSGSGYQSYITGGTQGGVPVYFWPLNDAASSLTITSVSASSGGTAVYHGTGIPSGLCSGVINPNPTITFSGFSNGANNGAYSCSSNTTTTLVMVNSGAIAETASATGKYPNAAAESIATANGTYTGAAVVNSVAGIPGDTVGTEKAAQFGGDTLYAYYLWECDDNGGAYGASNGCTNVSPAGYAANFSTLNESNYNQVQASNQPQGIRFFTLARGNTSSGCIAQGFLDQQFPINDTGTANWPTATCSPAAPARNSTGDSSIPGNLAVGGTLTLGTPLAVAQGGTGTASTLTGLVRGNSSAMTAAELSGDVTTSGSNAATVVKINGTSLAGLATGLLRNTTSTGVPTIATLGFSIDIPSPATSDTNLYQHKFGTAVTLTRISCSTDTGTVGINFDVRAEATPNTSGSNVLSSDLSCTTTTGVTTSFSTAAVAANVPLNLQVNSASGTPGIVRIHVAYQ
jgi:hypothetical protein